MDGELAGEQQSTKIIIQLKTEKMAKKKKSSFGKKVGANAKKQKSGPKNYGYLKLPGGIPVFNAPPGDTIMMDFLPYEITNSNHLDKDEETSTAMVGDEWYRVPFFAHRNIGANNDAVVCLRTFGKKCPICEERNRLEAEGADENDIKALRSSRRSLYCIIPHDSEKNSGVVNIWDMSDFLFQEQLNDELEEDESNWEFADLKAGQTLKVRFSQESFAGSKFAKTSRIDFKKRKNAISGKLIKTIPKMDDLLVVHTYKKLEQMLHELPDDTEEDKTSSEDSPKRKNKKTKSDKAGKGKKKGDCPEGYKFGKDTGKYDECDDCKMFEECHDKFNG